MQWPVEKGQGCYRRRLCKAILGWRPSFTQDLEWYPGLGVVLVWG